jgi:hypothetical protein
MKMETVGGGERSSLWRENREIEIKREINIDEYN